MYILSICIPTFNRPQQLKRLLNDLAPQINDDVEILIRDDSDNELTKKVVDLFFKIETQKNIKYIKGKKIGVDAATLFLLENARGKFIWFYGDDDQIEPGAVSYVLDILNKYPIDYIWINFSYGVNNTALPLNEDRYFRDNNEVLVLLGRSIGFLSSILIKREKALLYLALAKQNIYGFAFAVLIPVLGILKAENKLFLISKPLVINNPTTHEEIKLITNNDGVIKNDGFYVYGVYLKNVLIIFEENFDKNSLRKFIKKNFRQTWMGMVVGYCGEFDTPKGKIIQMIKHYWTYPEIIVPITLLLMPRKLVNYMYLAYKKFW